MFMIGNELGARPMPPQPPPPPEIEGYLKKLKRKTTSLTGGWNKRWFFVDPKRREFGYAPNKEPNAPKSSIYLNDITAVVQFDDTHFQVESKSRNFFLRGESKASTTCWVKSLEEYRKKLVEYERHAAMSALLAAPKVPPPDLSAASVKPSSNQKKSQSGKSKKKLKEKRPEKHSARESSSSSLASFSTAASSSNLSEDKHRTVSTDCDAEMHLDARRSPAPVEARRPDRRDSRSYGERTREREREREHEHELERERERERERVRDRDRKGDRNHGKKDRDRERERERDRSRDHDRSGRPKDRGRDREPEYIAELDRQSSMCRLSGKSGMTTSSSRTSSRNLGMPSPPNGCVIEAWVDDFD